MPKKKAKKSRPPVHDMEQQKNVDPVDVAGVAAPYVIFLEKKIEVLLKMFSELEKNFNKGADICQRGAKAEEELEHDPEIQQFLEEEEAVDNDSEYQ